MYDIFYVSRSDVDDNHWINFKKRFPIAQKLDNIKNFDDLKKHSFTNMFWVVWDDLDVVEEFNFSHKADKWDNMYVHVFKNGDFYDGICLFPKKISISQKEFDDRWFINKKEIPIIASYPKKTSEKYDIVFISYDEINADENYENLKSRFSHAKRIHGVDGIHRAHKEAARISETDMFWVVDGDAQVLPTFLFDYSVPKHNKRCPHVWRSRNPINDLEYGYGGVKLFPRELTLELNLNTPDMTTSISDRIIIMNEVSNITVFNADPFNAWKSAFRECCKLSSKIIKGQVDSETESRLERWCSDYGKEKMFGEYAIIGAISGKKYGLENSDNIDNLMKINDFKWLKDQFSSNYKIK